MPKSMNQKGKLLALREIFIENTDENHKLTLEEILALLDKRGIQAERKTIYSDIDELIKYNMDIAKGWESKGFCYGLLSRDFEFAEIKLLVDSVLAAKFVSESRTQSLINKLSKLVSKYDAKKIKKRSLLANKVKTHSKNVLISVDKIQEAILCGKKIAFKYWQWNMKKKKINRHDDTQYVVSPYSLVWDNEYYYLLAYDKTSNLIKHYRVDKMRNIDMLDDDATVQAIDIDEYKTGHFSMFGGEKMRLNLLCHSSLAGVIIDRFGENVAMTIKDDEHFVAYVDVYFSAQFMAWLIGLGDGIKIISPSKAIKAIKTMLDSVRSVYD